MKSMHESLVAADPTAVWSVYADVQRWPDWTASVTRVTPLDGDELAVGRRFRIEQPKFPALVWSVTALTPGRAWTWQQRSLGSTAVAIHELTPAAAGTHVRMTVINRGPVGAVVGLLTRRLTRRYLELEAAGLTARCERAASA